MMVVLVVFLFLLLWIAIYLGVYIEEKMELKEIYNHAMINVDECYGYRWMYLYGEKALRPELGRRYTIEAQRFGTIAVFSGLVICLILFLIQTITHIMQETTVFYISIVVFYVIAFCSLLFRAYVSKTVRTITEYNSKNEKSEQMVKRICRNEMRKISSEHPEVKCSVRETTDINFWWNVRCFWIDCGADSSKLIAREKRFRYAAMPCYYINQQAVCRSES